MDHAADGIRAVFRARRTADDLDALDVLRTDAQQLVAVAVVLRLTTEHALPIHEQQRVAWVTAADRYTDVAHRVDCTCHADLVKDYVLDGLCLFACNVLRRDDRRRLRFVFRLFLCGIGIDVNISSRYAASPLCTIIRPYGIGRHGEPCHNGAGEQAMEMSSLLSWHKILL